MSGFQLPNHQELDLPTWRREKKGSCLVTGAAGFLSSYVIQSLLESGRAVVAYDLAELNAERRFVIGSRYSEIAVETGSIDDRARLFDVVKKYDVSEIVHGATIIDPDVLVRQRDLGFSVNVHGTLNVLEAARALEVSKVVYISSIGVLPKKLYEPIDAAHPLILANRGPADDFYGAHKLASEAMCFAYHQALGVDFRIVRPSAMYGLGMNRWVGPLKDMIECSVRREPVRFATGGRHPRDYTHAHDVAALVVVLLNETESDDRVFYGATGEELVTASEVAALVRELISDADIDIGEDLTPGEAPSVACRGRLDVTSGLALGWSPRFRRIRDGLANYIEEYTTFLAEGSG